MKGRDISDNWVSNCPQFGLLIDGSLKGAGNPLRQTTYVRRRCSIGHPSSESLVCTSGGEIPCTQRRPRRAQSEFEWNKQPCSFFPRKLRSRCTVEQKGRIV